MSKQTPLLTQLLHSLDEIQAIDIQVLDVREQTTITDYMVICSGRSSRHVKATAQRVMEDLKTAGFPALSATGLDNGDWVLLDFAEAIVHIMQPESRQYYNLEGLWSEHS